jgi:hypothetical protein
MPPQHGPAAARRRRGDRRDAARISRAASTQYPGHPLAAAGLAVAEGRSFDVDPMVDPVTCAIAMGALGRPDEAAALLHRTLDDAPPGFTGWWLPAEPLLSQHTDHKGLAGVMKRLADRAR